MYKDGRDATGYPPWLPVRAPAKMTSGNPQFRPPETPNFDLRKPQFRPPETPNFDLRKPPISTSGDPPGDPPGRAPPARKFPKFAKFRPGRGGRPGGSARAPGGSIFRKIGSIFGPATPDFGGRGRFFRKNADFDAKTGIIIVIRTEKTPILYIFLRFSLKSGF